MTFSRGGGGFLFGSRADSSIVAKLTLSDNLRRREEAKGGRETGRR